MKRFTGALSRTTNNTMLIEVVFTNWWDLFQMVADDNPNEKKVLATIFVQLWFTSRMRQT